MRYIEILKEKKSFHNHFKTFFVLQLKRTYFFFLMYYPLVFVPLHSVSLCSFVFQDFAICLNSSVLFELQNSGGEAKRRRCEGAESEGRHPPAEETESTGGDREVSESTSPSSTEKETR